MYLHVCLGNPNSLPLGWKVRATFSFVVLNQSLKELYRLDEPRRLFSAQEVAWSCYVPLEKLHEKGVLEKNKLTLKVQVEVVEVVDEENEKLEFDGRVQVLASQVYSVIELFMKHPDIARSFRPRKHLVKTACMNDLLSFIEILNKPPYSLSQTELNNILRDLIELAEAGITLDWIKKKHDEIQEREIQERESNKIMIAELNKGTKAITRDARDWLKGVVHSWK
ncbi:hypothetical protein EUTSA_v10029219mg, partial [Eutrema salsugineum]